MGMGIVEFNVPLDTF